MSTIHRSLAGSSLGHLLGRTARSWAGLVFALGNLLFLVNKLDEMSRLFLGRPMPDIISGQNPVLISLGQVALVVGFVALYETYAPRARRGGRIALRLFASGGILLALGHITFMTAVTERVPAPLAPYAESLFVLVVLGLLLVVVGLVWWGLLNLRQPILRPLPWLPLATGIMGFVGFFLYGGPVVTAPFLLFRTLFALGLIGLGLVLWHTERGASDSSPEAN